MCRVLGVSPSGYSAWRERPLSPRARADVKLSAEIQAIHRESRGTHGVPRIHAELADRGLHVGRKRVARLMRGAGLQGVSRRNAFRTTVRDETARPAPDLVERQFTAAGPDQLWVADITPTYRHGPGSCIWPSSSMPGVAVSLAGRWKRISGPSWCSPP
jgi:putative transposase